MFSTYHMNNPAVFYNKEDQWEVPAIGARPGAGAAHGARTTRSCGCPARRNAEFIQMLPFTPRQKDNLAAWMVARSDGDHYGQLVVFKFPKQKVIFGPRQVVARISQDQVISPQITLWNQQGSEVIQGTLLVIPIEESLLYIRPLYLKATGGRIPELKRVIVAYQNQIVMEETLDAGIERIFGRRGAAPPPGGRGRRSRPPPPAPPAAAGPPRAADAVDAALAAEAPRPLRARAQAAQREGNWALYGEEIKKLGEVLAKMPR